MSAEITALKYQKGNRERVSVYLDGRFAFGVPAILAAALRPGQILSDAEVNTLKERGDVEEAYNSALHYLSYRPRSRAEVVSYLQRRRTSKEQIQVVAERLEKAGLLGDEQFAQFWVENRERFRPRGPAALRYELRSKGISNELIEHTLSTLDTSESAYQAAGKRAQQLSHLDRTTFSRKLTDYLARRGFGYEVARETAERFWTELTDQS